MTEKRREEAVYIPKYLKPIWEQLKQDAAKAKVGKGYYILMLYCKLKNIEMPEYRHGNQYTYKDDK